MRKRTSTEQSYEPLVTPESWKGDELRFSVRLTQILDGLFARLRAMRTELAGKLGRAEQAADSAKLGGADASSYALKTDTAPNAEKLGGVPADSYALRTDTAPNAEKLGGKAPEYYLTPVNLLDNSWFGGRYVDGVKEGLVCQAGLNGFHGTNKYPMDRWISWNLDAGFADGYITVNSPYDQRLDPNKIDANKVYTVAACFADGKIVCSSGTASSNIGGYANIGLYLNYNNGAPYVRMWHNGADNYRWVALYEGAYTADTLPPYVPKPYAVELAECQKYAADVTNAILPGVVTQNGVCFLFLPMPVGLRQNANPSVTLKNNLYAYTSGENYALTFSQAETQKTGVKLTFTCSSTVNTCATVPDFNAFITADL